MGDFYYKSKKQFSDAQEELKGHIEDLCSLKVKLRPDSEYYSESPPDNRYELENDYQTRLRFVLKRYRKKRFMWR